MNVNYEYEKRNTDFYFRSDNRGSVSLACTSHLHYHVEIAYIEYGKVDTYVDSEKYTLYPGDVLVVFPNRIHRFESADKKERYKLFIINPDIVPDLVHRLRHETPTDPVIREANKNKRLMSLIKILADYEKILPTESNDMLRGVIMKGYILSFFGEIFGMLPMTETRSADSQAMRAILDYCSQNFTQELSLSSLEREIHLSKYYISHLFSDKLGVSFNEYINSLRVSEACRHLRFGESSITEISAMSGFGTLRTFNRAFVKQMGMSPSQYRKTNRHESSSASVPS
ncbi:MAG: AraC family transcriptional regulator [Ruminococcaceae bacterium]|nr:AraC family transcriptional regulator [Oscillospiraceae bacterium]